MVDRNSENRGSLEEREKATKELFERDLAKAGTRKDLEADDVLGSDHHEVAQTDVAMAEKADDKLHGEAEEAIDSVAVKSTSPPGAEQELNENSNQSRGDESRAPKSPANVSGDDVAATSSAVSGGGRVQQAHGLSNQVQQETHSSVAPSSESASTTASLGNGQPEPNYDVNKLDPTDQKSVPDEPLEATPVDGGDQELVVANLMLANPQNEQDYSYELIGSGSDYFELLDNQILIKPGVDIDTTQSSYHSLTFQLTDRLGNSHQETVVITVDFTTEEAVIVLGIPEEQTDPINEESDSLTHVEPEPDESLTYSLLDGSEAPAGFILHEDGSYDLDVTHEAYQHLGVGDSQTLIVPVQIITDQGEVTTNEIHVVVHGSNDLPIVELEQSGVITEGSSVIEGEIHATDVDDNSVLTYALSDENDLPPGFVLSQNGHYSFTAENYNGLGAGESQVVEIPITVTDEHGATAHTTLSITITGTNDTPVAVAQEVSTEEGGLLTGWLEASDVDLTEGAALSFSTLSDVDGLNLNGDGSYSFDASAYQSLGEGETQTISVPVTVADDQGAIAETTLTITITGTNDIPVAEAHDVSADEGDLVTGLLQASDVDLSEGSVLSFSTSTEVEGLTLNEDGSYSFDASSYQSLGAGETETIEVPVTVTDDQGATDDTTLTITVTGTNDNPVAEAHEVSAEEGGLVTGQLQASDIDLAEGASLSFSTESEIEGLTLNEDGSYSFDASSYQSLGAGETETIEVPVVVTDDQGGTAETTLTITVTGTNDTPVAEAHEVLAEEGGSVTGQLQASDVDLADGALLSFTTSSEIDGLTLNEDGSYSFDASSYQSLGAGETETIEVPVTVTDDQGATDDTTLTITVTGTNDVPVAEAQQTAVEEGEFVKGQLKAGDIDLAEGSALSFSTSTEVEGLTLNEDGSYSFDASFYHSLGAGETETIEVPVTVTDDQGATDDTTLTITVTGTNDVPVAEAQQTAVEEGEFVKGQLKAGDIDLAEGSALSFSTATEVEGLTLNEDGSYSFDASSYQSLGADETEILEVPVVVTDDQGGTAETTLTITVTGTNDNPVAEAREVSVEEGGLLAGQLQASDIDLAEGASLSFSTESEIEGLTLNEDGSYSFDASSYQSLGAGETETIEVPVTVIDDQGATDDTTLTITVTGTNDVPVAEAQQTAVEEGEFVKGQLKAGDIDLAEGSALSFSTATEVDGLTLNEDGSYSFDASSYQSLGAGEVETLEVPVVVTDDQGGTAETTLTITVTGTNDTPVAEAHEVLAEEGGSVTGQLQASDVDLADGALLSFTTSSEIDGLTLNEDGSYSFDASFYHSLGAGETEIIEVPVMVTDNQGATDDTTLTITVTGTNDVPVAEAQQTAVEEGEFVKGQLKAGDIDLAEGSALSFSTATEVEGLTLNEDGSYSFDASSYQSLGAGDAEKLEVPVVVTDDQGATAETTLTFTITGTNDGPVAEAQQTTVDEGDFVKGQLKAGDIDLKQGSALSFSTASEVEGLVLYEDGSYSFDASSYQSLGVGKTETLEVPVTVTDDQGATAETTLTITVTGTNDVPVAEAQQTAVEEGEFVKGQLKAGDIDLAEGSALSFSTSTEVEGLTLNENGSYNFDASSYQSLGAGETETLEVPVTVTDDQGATAETTLTITVTGTNDVPVAEAQQTAVEEGEFAKGQLKAGDIDLAGGSVLSFSTASEVDGLTLNEDGSYSFDASSYQSLGAGETEILEVPVVVTDDHGGTTETTLTITVTGTNDLPLVVAEEIMVDEGEIIRGQFEADDIDLPTGSSLTFSTNADIDGLTLHADGSYNFDASGYEGLTSGDTTTIEVPVMVEDDQGGKAETILTINVEGVDSNPDSSGGPVVSDPDKDEENQGREKEDREEHRGRGDREDREEHRGRGDREDREEYRGRGDREDHRNHGDRDDREEHRGRGDRDDREEHRGRGDREDREEHRGRGGRDDREDREEYRGRGDREDREEHRGRGDREDREDREEHRGRGEREDREEHRGRGDREDQEEHRGRGDRDNREEHRGRGDQEDREEHRGRGDRDDREEHRGRGDRDDREEYRGRGDRDNREEHRGRGDRDNREEHRGRGDREDREEHRGRGDREDREEYRGRGDRDDREEHRSRGDRDNREEHRGRGDREDREEHRGRGDREDREEHRGRGRRDDREEHRGRGDREEREEYRSRGDREDREEHRGRGDHDDREHHRGWGHRDDWDEHPRNSEHGERHVHRGHRFRQDNEESQAAPTDIQVQGGVVEEGSSSGTVVATLSAIDEDSGEQFSYDLIRDDSGHFEIVGDQLVVTHGADIDYEDRSAHQISIRVTDSTGNTFTETIAINVADVQEAMSVEDDDYSNSDDDDDSGLLEDSEDLDHSDELDDDSELSTDSDFEFSEELSGLADGGDFDDSHDLDHEDREGEADNAFDGADYFDEGQGEGWTDVVQLNPDADPNADPSNPWAISVDGEQVQYDIADNALSVNPETSSQITFSDGSELTIEGVERIEW
ncbi:MAG: VCBS domain-containing protein [Candidatus Thiodiazotropha lotti]|nr:VCBS domain-containing protein [Candidatus Thiodiazotropha lotti]